VAGHSWGVAAVAKVRSTVARVWPAAARVQPAGRSSSVAGCGQGSVGRC
jgi:hypothetical protein